MPQIISVATPLPQPAGPVYAINQALPLFKTFNRISYKAATGQDAPEYDPHRDIKLWFDSAARAGHTTYVTLTTDAAGAFVTDPPSFGNLYLPVVIAATLNLPPDPNAHFPTWNPLPSDAVVVVGGIAVSPINPFYLSTEEQANELYKELIGVGGVQLWTPAPGPDNIHVQYGVDPRREFQFLWGEQMLNVGFLLREMYVNGVGAPGAWDLSGPAPRWIAHPEPPLPATYKVVPMPMRHLYKDESFDIIAVGQMMIQRR